MRQDSGLYIMYKFACTLNSFDIQFLRIESNSLNILKIFGQIVITDNYIEQRQNNLKSNWITVNDIHMKDP